MTSIPLSLSQQDQQKLKYGKEHGVPEPTSQSALDCSSEHTSTLHRRSKINKIRHSQEPRDKMSTVTGGHIFQYSVFLFSTCSRFSH